MRGSVSIGFRTKTDEEIRAELEKLTDKELIAHGKWLREAAKPSPGRALDHNWIRQLQAAGEEWKRRHPKP